MKKMKCEHIGGGLGMMDGAHISMMLRARKALKELDLSSDQKEKLKKVFIDETRKSIISEAEVKTLHLDLLELMREPAPEGAKIDAKIDEIAAACAGMAKSKIHAMRDVTGSLTPEQKEKWVEMKERMEIRNGKIKKIKRKKQ